MVLTTNRCKHPAQSQRFVVKLKDSKRHNIYFGTIEDFLLEESGEVYMAVHKYTTESLLDDVDINACPAIQSLHDHHLLDLPDIQRITGTTLAIVPASDVVSTAVVFYVNTGSSVYGFVASCDFRHGHH